MSSPRPQATSMVSDAMLAAVGTELSRRVSHPVSSSDIRKWAIAVYWPEPPPARYIDELPPASENSVLVAPEDFNPFAWTVAEERGAHTGTHSDSNDPDHFEHMAGVAGPGLRFMLNGGLEAEYGVPIRSDDVITSVRRLGPYSEQTGRLGPMLFGRTEEVWTNQHGDLVKRAVSTIIRY